MSPHDRFNEFLAEVLENPEARAAFEDSQSRNSLVDVLIRLRRRLGLTQTQVAQRMGVKQPTISGFETEGSDPRFSTIQRYARAVESDFIWEFRPKDQTSAASYYHPQDIAQAISVDVSHDKPSARAISWTKSVLQKYELAA